MDVFIWEAAVEPLQNKNAETVGRATKRAARELTGDDGNFVVTTDLGNEFATLDRELPADAVRRTKRPEDRNAIAVVDRGIQTLKKDLATRVARKGGQWSDHFEQTASAHNARPHETVHGAPEDVEKQPATEFRSWRLRGPGPSTSLKMIFGALFRPPRFRGSLKKAPFGAKKTLITLKFA